jgi:hypothetical protein
VAARPAIVPGSATRRVVEARVMANVPAAAEAATRPTRPAAQNAPGRAPPAHAAQPRATTHAGPTTRAVRRVQPRPVRPAAKTRRGARGAMPPLVKAGHAAPRAKTPLAAIREAIRRAAMRVTARLEPLIHEGRRGTIATPARSAVAPDRAEAIRRFRGVPSRGPALRPALRRRRRRIPLSLRAKESASPSCLPAPVSRAAARWSV